MQQRQTKAEKVADLLRAEIAAGNLRPNDRIRLQDWALRLQVSITPLREALGRLEREGYIEVLPFIGARVTAAPMQEFTEFYRIRESLDGIAAEFAAERLTSEARGRACERLRKTNQRLYEASEHGDFEEVRNANRKFHLLVYEFSGSSALLATVNRLWDLFPIGANLAGVTTPATTIDRDKNDEEHLAIIDAIEKGTPDIAYRAAFRHVRLGLLAKERQWSTDGWYAGRPDFSYSRPEDTEGLIWEPALERE